MNTTLLKCTDGTKVEFQIYSSSAVLYEHFVEVNPGEQITASVVAFNNLDTIYVRDKDPEAYTIDPDQFEKLFVCNDRNLYFKQTFDEKFMNLGYITDAAESILSNKTRYKKNRNRMWVGVQRVYAFL